MHGPLKRHGLLVAWSLVGVLVHSAVIPSTAMGEDAPSFQDTVRKIVAARSAIESYSVSITADVDDPAHPVQLTDGSTFTPTKKLVAYKLDVVADTKGERLLVARQDQFEDLTTKARTTTDWHIFATTPNGTLVARDGKGAWAQNPKFVEKPNYFDPLALGVAFQAEYQNGGPWRKVTDNYRAWSNRSLKTTTENDIVRFASDDVRIEVDTRRGYWPLRMSVKWNSLGERTFETELELKQVNGQWLPASSTVKLSDGSKQRLTLDWKSVNESVASSFDMNAIQTKYGLNPL